MNKVTHSIDLNIPRNLQVPVVLCLINTVYFLRLFNVREYETVEIKELDIKYVALKDKTLRDEIKNALKNMIQLKSPHIFLTISFSFVDTSKSSGFLLLGRTTQSLWESWEFKIELEDDLLPSRDEHYIKAKKELRELVMQKVKSIIQNGQQIQHIPSPKTPPPNIKHEITVTAKKESTGMLGKFLQVAGLQS